MAEIEQRNIGERMSPEEEERLMKVVVENNEKIIKLQKYMGELQIKLQKKKEKERLMKVVVENNEKIIKLQKYMGELQIKLQKKKEEEARSHERKKKRWIDG